MPSANVFNELCVKTLSQDLFRINSNGGNAVYFRLCIDLMHILPPVIAEGQDGSHHSRYAECIFPMPKIWKSFFFLF